MSLADDRARPHHLPTLAPRVARSTHVIQPAKGWRQLVGLRQSSLAGRLPRPIDVKDHPAVTFSIHQLSGLLLVGVVGSVGGGREWATLEIIKKEGAESFNRRFCQRR